MIHCTETYRRLRHDFILQMLFYDFFIYSLTTKVGTKKKTMFIFFILSFKIKEIFLKENIDIFYKVRPYR